ncbi:acyl-coenzyme A oxidase 1-like [Haematobia irritans]|uniref:acyl-coenzyme A oxidase 1-like n=1 Tax=Haematobia irritans TaxID=7368 RepID=UPI003F4FB75D
MRVASKLRKLQDVLNPGGSDIWPDLFMDFRLWGATPRAHPFSVHFAIAIDSIRKQGTDEQFEKFGKRAANLEIFLAFAQTELGHGTYLRGLETRADFDRATDEFILNTPTISSYKWWPGGLGHTANYAVVVANLYIDNEVKDVVQFVVQIRDENTHRPLPGIEVGDIGKKMGFPAVNNGYLVMKNVRIPRSNMLMRNTKVHRDGSFVKSPTTALTFFPMVIGRCVVIDSGVALLSMAVTIATRYSAVRRQGPMNANEPERQILDYATQQLKLFPEIANCVAYKFTAHKIWQLFDQTSKDITHGEYGCIPEMHALSCCIKVLNSQDTATGIEILRLACGGHGYLASSNMGCLYVDAAAACTYEGENTVLLLTTARFLLKFYQNAKDGGKLPPSAIYLREYLETKESIKWTGSWLNLVKILQYTAANKIRLAYEHFMRRLNDGRSEGEAFSDTGIELIQAAELHGRCFVAATFLQEVTGPSRQNRSSTLNKVLANLLELYLVNTSVKKMAHILRFIHLEEADLCSLQNRLEKSLKSIRPDAVAICDGFDFHDNTLTSTLGCYDGNVYERIYEAAKLNPLNRQEVPDVYHTHIKPFAKSKI